MNAPPPIQLLSVKGSKTQGEWEAQKVSYKVTGAHVVPLAQTVNKPPATTS